MPKRKSKGAGRVGNYRGPLGGESAARKVGKRSRKLKLLNHAKGWQKSKAKGRSRRYPTKFKTLGKKGRKR